MKKGFTIIELVAVFTLIGILLLISLPQITSLLKKGNIESYEDFKKNIFITTEAYVVGEKIEIENGSSKIINLNELLKTNYLKSTLVNPNTNEKVSQMTTARILVKKNNDGILSYEFFES